VAKNPLSRICVRCENPISVFLVTARAAVRQQFEPLKRITAPLAEATCVLSLEPEQERLRGASLMQRDELCGAARCIPAECFLSGFFIRDGVQFAKMRGDKNSNSMLLGPGDGCGLPARSALTHLSRRLASIDGRRDYFLLPRIVMWL